MAIREIKILGDPVLREPAVEVAEVDEGVRALVEDMLETMYHAEGIGLAAPQVGISSRVIVVDLRDSDEEDMGPLALINPRVVESGKKKDKAPEGCLSIPGMEEIVERPDTVTIEGLDPDGDPVSMEVSGLLSRALQHEIDHLDGVLFIDRLSPLKRRMALKKWQKSRAEEVAS
ncbi:MAG: peptide deformylase [Gemmatimonadetes bacterium]|nr:peptide deformylase [Gemmatimonadota bacterium]NNM04633.1 peptide deformylase [Gemmatimonadota bacterium]